MIRLSGVPIPTVAVMTRSGRWQTKKMRVETRYSGRQADQSQVGQMYNNKKNPKRGFFVLRQTIASESYVLWEADESLASVSGLGEHFWGVRTVYLVAQLPGFVPIIVYPMAYHDS